MFKELISKKNKELIINYLKNGQIFYLFFSTLINGVNKTSFELSRIGAQNKLKRRLEKKYKHILEKETEKLIFSVNNYPDKIWICWFQGIENSPQVVQKCMNSIKQNSNRDIIIITDENYKKYTNLPDYIIDKYEQGLITKTHFSDILRVDLLAFHGGTWIDSTVLLTEKMSETIINADLFFYQKCKPGRDGNGVYISSWLISAKPKNDIVLKTRELILEYWSIQNRLTDYFLFHIFFCMACERYPESYKKVFKLDSSAPHYLQLEFVNTFSEERYNQILKKTGVHKLTYKVDNDTKIDNSNFFNYILKMN